MLATTMALFSDLALAGQFAANGDGSATDNPDLLGNGYTDCTHCDVWDVPREQNPPFFDLDWGLALRGGYVQSTTGNGFEGSILPRLALTHQGLRSSFGLTANAELTQTTTDPFRIAAAAATLSGDYRFDPFTVASASASIALTQDEPNLPATVTSAQVLSGNAQVALDHRVGAFDLTARGTAGRTLYGPTTLAGGIVADNSWKNNTALGGGLRVAYPLSPLLSVFADGSATYQYFDGPSPTLLAKLDGPTYAAKVGLSYELNSTLSAEASVGLGLRRFDAGFADVSATLYDAKVTFRPDETLTINGVFGTALMPPGETDTGLARVVYTAGADATYIVNPWLSLRASAGWYHADIVGSGGGVETGYDVGVGSDYALNENTALTADYTFTHKDAPPSTPTDTHKFLLGVNFSK